jgi:hypothetical protein
MAVVEADAVVEMDVRFGIPAGFSPRPTPEPRGPGAMS